MNYSTLRTFIILLSSLTLAACGSGGGGGGDGTPSNPTPQPTNAPQSVEISGIASKGIVIAGVVNVHPITNGTVDFDTSLASTTTDVNGAYSVELTNHDGSAVYVRITANSSTTMRCDLAEGCGSSSFGEDVSISDINSTDAAITPFSLDAVIPSIAGATLSSNVSPLTNTAAALALDALASATDTSSASVSQIINNANGSVALRFGLTSDLLEVPIIDLTDATAVAAADEDDLQYNLMSTALVEAVLGASDTNIAQAIQAFATQYVDDDGIAATENSETSAVTMEEILSAAVELVAEIESEGSLDLSTLENELIVEAGQAGNGSTEPTNGTPSNGNASELVLAKSMVADIRDLGTSVDLAEEQAFTDKVEIASDTFDTHAGEVMEAVELTLEAIIAALEAWNDDNGISSYAYQGLTVNISTQNSVTTLSHASNISVANESGAQTVVAVDMSAVQNALSANETENDSSSTLSVDVDLSLSGTAASSMVEFEIVEGTLQADIDSASSEAYNQQGTDSDGNSTLIDEFSEEITITNYLLEAEITLAEASGSVNDPVTFTGAFQLSISDSATDNDYTYTWITNQQQQFAGWVDVWVDRTSVGDVAMTLGGSFSTASGDSMSATLALSANGNGVTIICEGEDSYDASTGIYIDAEVCEGETANAYIDVNFSLGFDLDVSGLESGSVVLTGNRTGLDDGIAGIEISYGDILLDIEYDSVATSTDTERLSIENQDGVVLTIEETFADNGSIVTGTITVNGTEYATISDELGFVSISFNDGNSESL